MKTFAHTDNPAARRTLSSRLKQMLGRGLRAFGRALAQANYSPMAARYGIGPEPLIDEERKTKVL